MAAPNSYPRQDRHAQAAYWFIELGKDDCTTATRKAFTVWLEDAPANRKAFQSIEAAWHESTVLEASTTFESIRREALIDSVRKPRLWRRGKAGAMAAGLAASVLLCATILLVPALNTGPIEGDQQIAAVDATVNTASDTLEVRTISTGIGERNSLPLADGSLMELNTSTSVRVAFTENLREVVLLSGQAVFNVATDPDRPFVVLAGDRRITAIGTEFEVRVDDDDVAVTLLEGRVEVASVRVPDNRAAAPIEDADVVALAPGERLSSRQGVAEQVSTEALERAMSWREGWLRFENETLYNVIIEINRYSRQNFELESEDLGALRVSGNFRAGSVQNFASAIVEIYPVQTYPDPNAPEAIVIAWRD